MSNKAQKNQLEMLLPISGKKKINKSLTITGNDKATYEAVLDSLRSKGLVKTSSVAKVLFKDMRETRG